MNERGKNHTTRLTPSQAQPYETRQEIADDVAPWVVELRVVGTSEIVRIPSKEIVEIGRCDAERGIDPDVDLTQYEGKAKGVSRRHARMIARDNRITVEDLGSANGTYINGLRLQPGQSARIRSGDMIHFGGLEAQINFIIRPLNTEDTIVGADQFVDIPKIGQGERLLIIDDEPNVAQILQQIAEHAGFTVATCATAEEAIRRIDHDRPAILLTELMLSEGSGLDIVRYIRSMSPEPYIPVMAITAATGGYTMGEALDEGVDLFAFKPTSVEDIVSGLGTLKEIRDKSS